MARVYTPKDFELSKIMGDIVELVAERSWLRRRVRRAECSRLSPVLPPSSAAGSPPATDRPLPPPSTSSRTGRRGGAPPPPRCSPRCPPRRSAARRPLTSSGVTGPPGAGKSSLLSALVAEWRGAGRTVAVLAVDPSSKRSGGSLLGDRARIDHDPRDDGVLIRSTAAGTRLGGLAPPTREAAHALAAAFDVVVVETVGVGQSETDVEELCDTTVVVVQPASGRHAPVPQGGHHGGAGRAGGDEGRPRRRRAARPARPAGGAALARLVGHARS